MKPFTDDEIARLRLVLKRISFLEFLKMSEMDALIGGLEKRPFRKGEMIIKQGQKGDRFYLMGAGTVGIYRDKLLSRTRIATLGPESFFGEMALIDDSPRSATVIGDQDGELYALSRDSFQKILLNNPGIGAIIRQIAAFRRAQNKAESSKPAG